MSFNVALNISKPFTEYNMWSRVCLCGSSGVYSYTHVLFLDLDSSVVERVETVLTGCYRNHHFGRNDLPIDALCALRRNSKNFAHNASD